MRVEFVIQLQRFLEARQPPSSRKFFAPDEPIEILDFRFVLRVLPNMLNPVVLQRCRTRIQTTACPPPTDRHRSVLRAGDPLMFLLRALVLVCVDLLALGAALFPLLRRDLRPAHPTADRRRHTPILPRSTRFGEPLANRVCYRTKPLKHFRIMTKQTSFVLGEPRQQGTSIELLHAAPPARSRAGCRVDRPPIGHNHDRHPGRSAARRRRIAEPRRRLGGSRRARQ